MRHIRYQGKRLIKTSHPRRGLSALLCVCMMLSIVNFTAIGTPARADNPPAETPGLELEDIPNSKDALHFLIRHWHIAEDRTSQYQGGTKLQSGDRYITVTEGYIIPVSGGGYSFYAVIQGTGGSLAKMDPETFSSNYVASMDPANGSIVLTPYFVEMSGDPVEKFAGWSISTGHDAIKYDDNNGATDERLTITYKANVHLVKGHAFYVSAGEIVEGSVEKAVFGSGVTMNLEKDVDWAWVFTEGVEINGVNYRMDDVAVDKDGVPYSEFDLPSDLRPYVEWMQIHNTNEGLHTDKTALDNYPEDGRTYDVDLKAWYTGGYAPIVGMVLDASGSMGFAADIPEPIKVDKDKLEEEAYNTLSAKIGLVQREKAAWDETYPLLGYYEIESNVGGQYGNYRLWYFNSVKDDKTKYTTEAMFQSDESDDYFAHAVKQSTLDNIDFRGSAAIKHSDDYNNVEWNGSISSTLADWSNVPINFSSSNGLLLNRENSNNSGFLLDVAPKDTANFTVAFTLKQTDTVTYTEQIEILYIGPTVAGRDDNYFRVYRSNNDIIAEIDGQRLTLSGHFSSAAANRNFSFVFRGDTVTAYVNGALAGRLDNVTAISPNDTCVVFDPFKDDNKKEKFYVDSICLFDAALDSEGAKFLNTVAGGSVKGFKYSIPSEEFFLNAGELALLMDTHKTDNSDMGFGGYSYFVFDSSEGNQEYCPLAYYTNGVPYYNTTNNNVNGSGWYYVNNSGDWAAIEQGTSKTLRGLSTDMTYEDTIKPNVTVNENSKGAAPDKVEESTVLAGNSGATYTPTSKGPTKFYIDGEGYLRCFAANSNTTYFTSYVYELQDEQYIKQATLQRALGDFVTQLNEAFPQSDVAATRFSTQQANNHIDELVLLDWTHDVTKSVGILNQKWGSGGTPGEYGQRQYDYVFTGGTYTWTGLQAFQQYLAPIKEEDRGEKFLIVFTDGKDSQYDSDKGESSRKIADDLKAKGYTIFTVLLSGGSVAEGTDDYNDAYDFLVSLSGTSDPNEDKKKYFFSIYTAENQMKDDKAQEWYGRSYIDDELTQEEKDRIDQWYYDQDMNTADVLTQIFSKDILSEITKPLEDYVVQDYIDPRFDLMAGIATKEIDDTGVTNNIPDSFTVKNDYTLHLRVDGEVAIGNEDASVIYATVNLKDGTVTDSKGSVFHAGSGVFTDSGGRRIESSDFDMGEFLDEYDKPLDPSRIITWTGAAADEDDPDPGGGSNRYYLNIYLISASKPAAWFACLFYDDDYQMYYLQWMNQTIPASTYNQTALSVWRARITLRAKEDFLGGNAVLTNGQYDHMNYIYHTGDEKRSSGTERSYWDDSGTGNGVPDDGHLSKGFPRVTVNVALPDVTMRNSEWTLWVGETMDPAELIQRLAESIDNSLIWEGYMSRYGHSIVPYPDELKELSLTQLTQLSSLYRLHVAMDEAEEDSDEKTAAEAAYNAYRAGMDADLQAIYDRTYKEYADKVKNPSQYEEYGKAIYNKLRRELLAAVGIGRDLTYYSTNQLMAGLLDDANTEHGLYLPYAYLNSFDMDGGSEGNQAGLIEEQQRDVLGVIRYRWERVNYYTGETIKDGGYFRSPGEGKLENGVPSLNQEFTIYDTRTLLYRLTVTFWPFPDPSDTVWDSLIYVHDEGAEVIANQGKTDSTGRYRDGIRYEAAFKYDDDDNRIPMDSDGRKKYLAARVKTPLEELQKALTNLEDGLTGYQTREELEALMEPFANGEYRKELYNGVTEMGFDAAIWGDAFNDLDKDINTMIEMFRDLNDDESNTSYYAQRLEVRDQIDQCLEDLRWFTYAVEYLEWCIGIQDTGGKFSHLDRTNDRNQFNYDAEADDGLDPDGYDDEGATTILTLIKDTDYCRTKEAVGTTQYYKEVEGSRTTHIVRGELAFEMKLDINELEYLFTTAWKDKAETGVTYYVDLTAEKVTEEWNKKYGDAGNEMSSPEIPKELTITITKSDLETLRERAALHATQGEDPVGILYYEKGEWDDDPPSGYDERLPNPNASRYPKAIYDASTGEVTFYTDPRIYDPLYQDENGKPMYGENNDYARLLPKGTYTLTPNTGKNEDDWWMFEFSDFGSAPLADYARDSDEQGNIQLRRSHFTDNTADNKANAVNSVYAPYIEYIDAMAGATPDMKQFQSDSNKYAPSSENPANGSVTFYLGTYDYNAHGVTNLQRLTARVGMGMVEASLRYEMPATGGPGTGTYLAAGGLTFLAGLGLFLYQKRRQRYQVVWAGQSHHNGREN